MGQFRRPRFRRGVIEIEPLGKCVGTKHGVVAAAVDDGHRGPKQVRFELRLVERAVAGRVFHQRPAGGHQRHVDPQRLDQRQGVAIAAAGGHYDADSRLAGPLERRPRGRRQLVVAVHQRAVDVNGEQAVHGEIEWDLAIRDQNSRG